MLGFVRQELLPKTWNVRVPEVTHAEWEGQKQNLEWVKTPSVTLWTPSLSPKPKNTLGWLFEFPKR